jgi:hypothetical protein
LMRENAYTTRVPAELSPADIRPQKLNQPLKNQQFQGNSTR